MKLKTEFINRKQKQQENKNPKVGSLKRLTILINYLVKLKKG